MGGYGLSLLFESMKHWNQSQMLFFAKYYWVELSDIMDDIVKNSCMESLRTIVNKLTIYRYSFIQVLKCILNLSFSKMQSARSIPRDMRIARSKARWPKKNFGKYDSSTYCTEVL